ncbi:ras family-domain-containing protein [Russula aff. rugulosa BPL654]|nr:ras family-domain-containing protein [Russula aff. rugulosa BPL654]
MSIWDTAGQECFRTITASYYRGVQGIMLVYDVSNREPFEALREWLEELENHVPPEFVKIVVGNKLYKVKSSPLLSLPSSFPNARHHGCAHLNAPDLGMLSTGAHHQKAQRSPHGRDVYSPRRPPGRQWV